MQEKHKDPNRPKSPCYSDHRRMGEGKKGVKPTKLDIKELTSDFVRQRPGRRILKSEPITDLHGFQCCDAVTLPPTRIIH